jgi:hypothetical protein
MIASAVLLDFFFPEEASKMKMEGGIWEGELRRFSDLQHLGVSRRAISDEGHNMLVIGDRDAHLKIIVSSPWSVANDRNI